MSTTPTATPAPLAPEAAAPAAPKPGTPEHDAAMAALVDQRMGNNTPAAPAAPAQRPDHIPEKFWNAEKGEVNVEAMAKSYVELERTRGTPAPATPPATPAAPTPGSNLKVADPATPDPTKAVADAGLDMGALQAEFMEKGDLTPETRAALAAKGFPQAMVDGYIAGQKALAADYDASAFAAAGGQEQYATLTTWAQTALSADEKVAFNKAVTSGDKAQAKLAIEALKARHVAAFGSQPNLLSGGAAPAGDVYESWAQVTADMRTPQYKKDPAFRAKVEAKLGRSDFAGATIQTR